MPPTLLDTDILSLFLRNHPVVTAHVNTYLNTYARLSFSLITYYEIVSGLKHRDAKRQLGSFEALSQKSDVLPLTRASVTVSAELYGKLRQQGNPLDDIDLLIAGVAIENTLQLATRNTKHFSRIEGLALQDWSQPH